MYVIQDVVLKTRGSFICIGYNCYSCALLYILCMLSVFTVNMLLLQGLLLFGTWNKELWNSDPALRVRRWHSLDRMYTIICVWMTVKAHLRC